MFLQYLLFAYKGQGNHLCHSSDLWLDYQMQSLPESSDTEQIQKSLEMASTLELSYLLCAAATAAGESLSENLSEEYLQKSD
ncbi:conserved hypothetical protein [Coccidioides posadasii str. Silveira]|uniref:Uncharacterized protein n=1 Tax=Coccidioides posadasii (strain RMSCC 757 / Silveira) TaxID=443226 RepID=E9D746_COCPS|nr:conserved hypothetical protein [Coccidioides posadasii str. Silveira]